MTLAFGRNNAFPLLNMSGGEVNQGDVVVLESSTAFSFDTTTEVGFSDGILGVILDLSIANGARGMIATCGEVPKLNLESAASFLDLVKTHSVAKQGTPHAGPRTAGDFAQVLDEGTSPPAFLFGAPTVISATAKGPIGITKLRKTAVQSITTGAWRTITWDVEDYDNLATFNSGVSTSNITVPAGITLAKVSLFASWANNSTSARYIAFKNNSNNKMLLFDVKGAINETGVSLCGGWIPVTAGDVYHLEVNSGTQTLNFGDASFPATYPQITIEWLDSFASLIP